jgi:hypothetical protein
MNVTVVNDGSKALEQVAAREGACELILLDHGIIADDDVCTSVSWTEPVVAKSRYWCLDHKCLLPNGPDCCAAAPVPT